MTEPKPKKTLTLKSRPNQTNAPDEPARRRSGARAHAARQRYHEQQQQKRIEQLQQPAAQNADRPDRSRQRRRSPVVAKSVGMRNPDTIYSAFAPCPAGLEPALFNELTTLGYSNVEQGRAGCAFKSDWSGIMRANLYSRLATRILIQVAQAPVQKEDDILELAKNTPWEHWFGPEHTLRLDTSAIRSPMKSLQYCNLLAKDGICDRLRDLEGARPSIDTVRPDARVQVFLSEHTATLYLDTTGESLFKRGWRFDKGTAPIRENLAAGLLALSGWNPEQPLIDPFCGSATILIEAAWMALGIAPGINRPFGFQRLRDYDHLQWQALKQEAKNSIKPDTNLQIFGFDTDEFALISAQNNIKQAGLNPDSIRIMLGDATKITPPCEPGWVVCNPPYGERMEEDDTLWINWAANLKQNYAGWNVNVISSNLDLPGKMRLKPKRRYPVHNGALECRLFQFEMVNSTYRN